MVKVKATGTQKITAIEIDESVMSEDREMLQDLITAAVNNASINPGRPHRKSWARCCRRG